MIDTPGDVTEAIRVAASGDEAAQERLWERVYPELKRLAHAQMRAEREGHTLNTTALVNEAFLKFVDQNRMDVKGRRHFFSFCCHAMRRILVDHARKRQAKKRSAGEVDPAIDISDRSKMSETELLALNEALDGLAQYDARMVQLVEARFFGGFSTQEVAEFMDVSSRTLERDWVRAKAYLYDALQG